MQRIDILIIGGGIAGMTAAIYSVRANMSAMILEKEICGGLVNSTYVLENVPSYPSINGMELMERVKDHAIALGVRIEELAEVTRLELRGTQKMIQTEDERYTARTVIIATGRVPIALPVETSWENIHYCSVCDGSAYADKDLVVVGGGNSGFDESLYLLGLGVNSITLVEGLDTCRADPITQERLRASGKARIYTGTRVVGADDGVITLKDVRNGKRSTIRADGIFVFIGQMPSTSIFKPFIALDDQGYILTDVDMQTNLGGVFAAGDVIAKKYRQITTAMSDGTIAALSAVRYLRQTTKNEPLLPEKDGSPLYEPGSNHLG